MQKITKIGRTTRHLNCSSHRHTLGPSSFWATPSNDVMWGGVQNVVNHAEFRQNWFTGFRSLGGQNRALFDAYRYDLYNRLGPWLGLPPNRWSPLSVTDMTIVSSVLKNNRHGGRVRNIDQRRVNSPVD